MVRILLNKKYKRLENKKYITIFIQLIYERDVKMNLYYQLNENVIRQRLKGLREDRKILFNNFNFLTDPEQITQCINEINECENEFVKLFKKLKKLTA